MAVETKISVELTIPSWIPPRLWDDYARCVTGLLKTKPLEHAEAIAEDVIHRDMTEDAGLSIFDSRPLDL